ncbi:hypothetical protein AHiyo8_12610 [Arthrobacter sp. Hiyo8]|nr:hypothetical protein AHiyo8_12610 [Arthrobacter sp. Hiyo8]
MSDESGSVVAKFYYGTGGGVGGACGPGTYKQKELDTAATSLKGQWVTTAQARFSYRVLDQTAKARASAIKSVWWTSPAGKCRTAA